MTIQDNFPNLFIIGAAKAGTTTLYNILNRHPQVYFPFDKEPAFFCDDEYYEKGVDWYHDTFFRGAGSKRIRGDATSRYLYWGKKVVPRLLSLYGSNLPRLIAIFRDPVDLVHSFYWQNVREGEETFDIRKALAAEERRMADNLPFLSSRGRIMHAYSSIALYATHLQPYLERFPKENFLFLLTEDLKDFPQLAGKLTGFLELDQADRLQPVFSNRAALPRSRRFHQWLRAPSGIKELFKSFLPYSVRHRMKMLAMQINLEQFKVPALDPQIAQLLRRHYAGEMKKLEAIIQRDLSGWYRESPG
jgi:hypothetical protein